MMQIKKITIAGKEYKYSSDEELKGIFAQYPNIKIGYGCVFHDNVVIGDGCVFGDNVIIRDSCTIGSGCVIDSGCVIGSNTNIGHNANIGNGCKIGGGCEIDDKAIIEYNTKIGNGCEIGYRAKIGSSCQIGDNTNIGSLCRIANNTITPKIESINQMDTTEFKSQIDDYLMSLGLPPLNEKENGFQINSALQSFSKNGIGSFFPLSNDIKIEGHGVSCYYICITKDGIKIKIKIGKITENQVFVINPTPERLLILINALKFSQNESVTPEEIQYYKGICKPKYAKQSLNTPNKAKKNQLQQRRRLSTER